MDKYTPEPWKVRKDGDEYYIEILSKYSGHLCQLGSGCFSKEDARRIVACVNACAGIETKTLESGEFATNALADHLELSGAKEIIRARDTRIAELESELANERAKVEMLWEIISNACSEIKQVHTQSKTSMMHRARAWSILNKALVATDPKES